MDSADRTEVPRAAWNSLLGTLLFLPVATVAILAALALGWNSPGPRRAPDWVADHLPSVLETSGGQAAISMLDHEVSDFTFEVTAAPSSDIEFDGYGLIYRARDDSHYYAFVVGADGYFALLQVDDNAERTIIAWQDFPHLHRGASSNTLRVTCTGSECQLRINDEIAATVDDSTWLNGRVGLWARAYDEPVSVTFTRAHVWHVENRLE